ncbi:hypothetical protein ACFVQB_05010 [Paenibacillus sp. NPDC057886]|uniref:hypothetical protein n=1 Tax=Paenibacillus sp. NPDC057886 TaxID=3346270 RepID=UPI0036C80CA2
MKYNKQLDHLHHKIDLLIKEQQLLAQQFSVPYGNRGITQKEDHFESSSQPPLM